MRAYSEPPVERVIDRLFGHRRIFRRKGERTIGIWTTRDGGTPVLSRGYRSLHRAPSGIRYNRFIRLRYRLGTEQRRLYNECVDAPKRAGL